MTFENKKIVDDLTRYEKMLSDPAELGDFLFEDIQARYTHCIEALRDMDALDLIMLWHIRNCKSIWLFRKMAQRKSDAYDNYLSISKGIEIDIFKNDIDSMSDITST